MGDAAEEIREGVLHDVARRGGTPPRPIFEHDVPPSLAAESGIQQIGLHIITGNEYEMALGRVRGTPARLALELPKQSLASVNGKRVSLADGSADRAWEQMGPKLRELVTAAYGELHQPAAEEAVAFLKSRRVVVG